MREAWRMDHGLPRQGGGRVPNGEEQPWLEGHESILAARVAPIGMDPDEMMAEMDAIRQEWDGRQAIDPDVVNRFDALYEEYQRVRPEAGPTTKLFREIGSGADLRTIYVGRSAYRVGEDSMVPGRDVVPDDPDRIIMEGITAQILQGVDGDINEQEREIQRFVQAAAEEPDTELERLERLAEVVESAVAVNDGLAHNRLRRAYQARLNQLRNDAAVRRRDSIAAMSHQDMWAEMASMRSRWNDVEFLEDMPDEIRERYEALVDAYNRAAPAGARRPDALGRSVV
jgi:hypothetical protein